LTGRSSQRASDRTEKLACIAQKYRILIRSTEEVQIWLTSLSMNAHPDKHGVGPTERGGYHATFRICQAVQFLVYSRLDYCSSHFLNLPAAKLSRLQFTMLLLVLSPERQNSLTALLFRNLFTGANLMNDRFLTICSYTTKFCAWGISSASS
jgi:hypothetical protein